MQPIRRDCRLVDAVIASESGAVFVHLQPLYSVGQTLKFIALLVGRICKNAVSSQDLSGQELGIRAH